jgi:hypothetical protein
VTSRLFRGPGRHLYPDALCSHLIVVVQRLAGRLPIKHHLLVGAMSTVHLARLFHVLQETLSKSRLSCELVDLRCDLVAQMVSERDVAFYGRPQ